MGSQWNGMGQELFDLPIFAEIIAKCDKLVKPKGIDIYHLLTSDDSIIFDSIVHAFVAITSMQESFLILVKNINPLFSEVIILLNECFADSAN